MLGKALSSESSGTVISCDGATSSVNIGYAVKSTATDLSNLTMTTTVDGVALAQSSWPSYLSTSGIDAVPTIPPPDGYIWISGIMTITNTDSLEHRIELESNLEEVALVMYENPCVMQFDNQHTGTCLSAVVCDCTSDTLTINNPDEGSNSVVVNGTGTWFLNYILYINGSQVIKTSSENTGFTVGTLSVQRFYQSSATLLIENRLRMKLISNSDESTAFKLVNLSDDCAAVKLVAYTSTVSNADISSDTTVYTLIEDTNLCANEVNASARCYNFDQSTEIDTLTNDANYIRANYSYPYDIENNYFSVNGIQIYLSNDNANPTFSKNDYISAQDQDGVIAFTAETDEPTYLKICSTQPISEEKSPFWSETSGDPQFSNSYAWHRDEDGYETIVFVMNKLST